MAGMELLDHDEQVKQFGALENGNQDEGDNLETLEEEA